MTLLARAAGVDDTIDSDAVRFVKPPALVDPARIPLVAGASAPLTVIAGEDGLRALALDSRGISVLRLEAGKIDRRRLRRTSLVRGAVFRDGEPLLIWAMPKDRCEQAADHCARRASGVAALAPDALVLPEPTWLGAHPHGRVDRSVRPGLAGHLDILAVADATGALEVRRFELPATSASAPSAPAPELTPGGELAAPIKAAPLAPTARFPLPTAPTEAVPSDARLLELTPSTVAYTLPSDHAQDAYLWSYESTHTTQAAASHAASAVAAPLALGHVAGDGAWLTACETDQATTIAFGTAQQLALTRVARGGEAQTLLSAFAVELGEPLGVDDPDRDRVRVLCDANSQTVVLVVESAKGSLSVTQCDAERCSAATELATRVMSFDAVRLGERTLIAYSRLGAPQLSLVRLDARGQVDTPAHTVAACWDPQGGMCGQPTLTYDSGRLLLCARDGSDLLALESEDAGGSWKPLSGLKISSAPSTDVSAPMNQHRLRKGIE